LKKVENTIKEDLLLSKDLLEPVVFIFEAKFIADVILHFNCYPDAVSAKETGEHFVMNVWWLCCEIRIPEIMSHL